MCGDGSTGHQAGHLLLLDGVGHGAVPLHAGDQDHGAGGGHRLQLHLLQARARHGHQGGVGGEMTHVQGGHPRPRRCPGQEPEHVAVRLQFDLVPRSIPSTSTNLLEGLMKQILTEGLQSARTGRH